MLKTFPIEFVRQAIEQTLYEEHLKNPYYFGGQDQFILHSFYEQLKTQEQVDRFVETYRDLVDQQNRTDIIGNGILMSSENPTITNLYSSLIVPFTFTCSVRTKLENRDQMLETLMNMVDKLKGRKCDIAQLECLDINNKKVPSLFKVGTLGQGNLAPAISSGDYICEVSQSQVLNTTISNFITNLVNGGMFNLVQPNDYIYYIDKNTNNGTKDLSVAQRQYDDFANYTTEMWDVEDAYYDQISGGKREANGHVIFQTEETGFKSIPSRLKYSMVILVYDGSNSKYITTTLVIDYSDDELTYIDSDGRIHFYAYFGFELVESEWDFGNISLEIDSITPIIFDEYVKVEDDGTHDDIVFPPEQTGHNMEKYKLSMSFDSFRVDEPRTLNSNEYCEITFGGSATLVNENVILGNDLIRVEVQKNKILAETPITFSSSTTPIYYLEPLELPSGLNANTQINQLISNNFKQNTHTDGTAGVLQYSFIMDKSFDILEQWFDYARFGDYGITSNDISPNMIYNVTELWSSWGEIKKKTMLCKIVESIDIENTESDVLTIGVTFQVQGENN